MRHSSFLLIIFGMFNIAQAAATRTIEVQGHRGARSLRPENTLSAFKYALENKVPVLEMDLQYTKDHVLVVGHDEILNSAICLDPMGKKLTSKVLVNELTLAELQKYDCGTLINPRFPKQI